MRVYLPGTMATLAELWRSGSLGAPPLSGCAVTPALREWYVDDDRDELEYAALSEAARTSLRRLAEDPEVPRRRVVLAADVPDPEVRPDDAAGRGHVVVSGTIPLSAVASVHVDEIEATAAVEAAVHALPRAESGDADAGFVLDEAESHELLWYATQEIPDLLAP